MSKALSLFNPTTILGDRCADQTHKGRRLNVFLTHASDPSPYFCREGGIFDTTAFELLSFQNRERYLKSF